MHQSLMRRLGDTSVPTLPQVAVRVIELVSNPKSTINQFAEVIRTDQALTGRLLRMSNSAYFAQREPITKLERAMVLLGLDRLKAVSLGFHLSKLAVGDDGEFSVKKLWTQSLFRAWAAFRVAEMFDKSLSGEAFIVGLMSDAGMPMMPKLAGDAFMKSVDPRDPPAKQYLSEFRKLEFTHVDVASCLCQMWKLPELLTKPICLHHAPAGPAIIRNRESILHATAFYVNTITLDPKARETADGASAALAQKLFNKSPEDMEKAFQLAGGDFRASRELFSQVLDENMGVEKILQQANGQLSEKVEELVVEISELELGRPESRFELDGMILEMESGDNNRVQVYIADSAGNRIVSEQIDTRKQSKDEISSRLLLDGAAPDVIASIFTRLNQLAA